SQAIEVLEALGWLEREGLVLLAPRIAHEDELAAVHERAYIRRVEHAARRAAVREEQGGRASHFFATDTYVSAKSFEAARMAAGAPLTAIDAIMSGEVENAYCLVRPPGHHAVAE